MKTILYQPKKNTLNKKIILIINTENNLGQTLSTHLLRYKAKVILLENNSNNKVYKTKIQKNLSIYPINSLLYTHNDYLILSNIIKNTHTYIDNIIINTTEPNILYPIKQHSLTQWNKLIQLNLNNTFLLLKTFIPLLNNITSPSITLTLYPQHTLSKSFFGAYACANAGLNAMMNILNDEYNNLLNIRINGIFTNKIKTKTRQTIYPCENKHNLKTTKNTFNCYTFLASNNSIFIKNKILTPNKNFTINITL